MREEFHDVVTVLVLYCNKKRPPSAVCIWAGSVIKELHDRVSVLIVDGRHKRSAFAVFLRGSSSREKQRQAGSVLIIVRMEDGKVHWREPLVVLPLYIDKLEHVLDLLCIAIFDVGVEETSMHDGGEEAPF